MAEERAISDILKDILTDLEGIVRYEVRLAKVEVREDLTRALFSGTWIIAGVVVAGFDANKVFIENGRYHGDKIVARLLGQGAPAEPKLSAELDT